MAIEKNGFEIHSVWQFTPISLSRVIVQLAALFGIFQALPTAASRWGRGHIQAESPLCFHWAFSEFRALLCTSTQRGVDTYIYKRTIKLPNFDVPRIFIFDTHLIWLRVCNKKINQNSLNFEGTFWKQFLWTWGKIWKFLNVAAFLLMLIQRPLDKCCIMSPKSPFCAKAHKSLPALLRFSLKLKVYTIVVLCKIYVFSKRIFLLFERLIFSLAFCLFFWNTQKSQRRRIMRKL